MTSSTIIYPTEVLYNFSPNILIRNVNKKRRFPRIRAFLARKSTKVAALLTYWAAETAAFIALAFSAPSLTLFGAFGALYLYASYVFTVAISSIVKG